MSDSIYHHKAVKVRKPKDPLDKIVTANGVDVTAIVRPIIALRRAIEGEITITLPSEIYDLIGNEIGYKAEGTITIRRGR